MFKASKREMFLLRKSLSNLYTHNSIDFIGRVKDNHSNETTNEQFMLYGKWHNHMIQFHNFSNSIKYCRTA